jgi:hypothetical protein
MTTELASTVHVSITVVETTRNVIINISISLIIQTHRARLPAMHRAAPAAQISNSSSEHLLNG